MSQLGEFREDLHIWSVSGGRNVILQELVRLCDGEKIFSKYNQIPPGNGT
jgi:hypothetical protein